MFADIWRKEDRPLRYQDRKAFDKLPRDAITTMFKAHSEAQKKKRQAGGEEFSKLKKLKSRSFKKGTDDGYTVLHEARFLRQPFGEPRKWWKQVPLNRDAEGVCMDLPLEFLGASNKVAHKTIFYLHDRSFPIQLRMLSPENVNIATRAKKRIEWMEGGELTNITDFWWTDVERIKIAQDCVLAYSSLLHVLWPQDPTGLIMLQVLHKYGWVAVSQDEQKRIGVVNAFFDHVIKETASEPSIASRP